MEALAIIAPEQPDEFQALTYLLTDWADWMGGYRPNIGYPQRVPILATGGGQTFDEWGEQEDNTKMKSIDASVDSLQPAQKAAIHRRFNICGVWRFPRDNYAEMLRSAYEALTITLKRKGVLTT